MKLLLVQGFSQVKETHHARSVHIYQNTVICKTNRLENYSVENHCISSHKRLFHFFKCRSV